MTVVDKSAKYAFGPQSKKDLLNFLERLQNSEAVMSYHQLQGLLFAMACSPEAIRAAEWFELIWLHDEPQFDEEGEAKAFFRLLEGLAAHVDASLAEKRYLPFAEPYPAQQQELLAQWCDGFLVGHHYLEDLWMVALHDLDDSDTQQAVEVVLNLASTFADLEAARQLSLEQGNELEDAHLPEAFEMFWQMLDAYAGVASRWARIAGPFSPEKLFEAIEPVDRDALCPCGSGQIFAKCCLH